MKLGEVTYEARGGPSVMFNNFPLIAQVYGTFYEILTIVDLYI